MAGRDGIEFLDAVRDTHPDVPFILYTAKGSEQVASEAIPAGVTDYFEPSGDDDEYTILANRITNLAERYRLEHEAEQTRSQLHAITESSADAIVTIDEDSIVRFANPAVEDIFGYDPADLLGEELTELMPERYRAAHLNAVEAFLETGERAPDWSNVEFTGQRADDTEVPLSLGEFDYDGEQRFVGIIRDISVRKRIEEALQERERRFRQIAENIQEVVWMSGRDNDELLYINPAYEEIWGRSVESLDENPEAFLEAVHPDDRDAVIVQIYTSPAVNDVRDSHVMFLFMSLSAVMFGFIIEQAINEVTGDMLAIQAIAIAVLLSRLYVNWNTGEMFRWEDPIDRYVIYIPCAVGPCLDA